jgi:hypothetical protein
MSMTKLISDTARIREEITSKIIFEVLQDEQNGQETCFALICTIGMHGCNIY